LLHLGLQQIDSAGGHMPSDEVNKKTREEWRALGFFYDRDDDAKVWTLIGSRAGLLSFRDALLEYVVDPRNALESEHEHYGPYMYLKVMTWQEAGFDKNAIRGPLADLARLAAMVEAKLAIAQPGSAVRIHEEFAADSPYALLLEIREDSFDPAAADPLLKDAD
jgi:hypothetical protein